MTHYFRGIPVEITTHTVGVDHESGPGLQLARHWRLSAAHCHHWAGDASPTNLAWGRAILRELPELAGASGYNHRVLYELDPGEPARQAERDADAAVCDRARELGIEPPPVPSSPPSPSPPWRCPETDEECEALSALPTAIGGGIYFDRDPDGALSHVTGTGRLMWRVEPDGTLTLTVYRPTGICLIAVVDPDGRYTVSAGPEVACHRHAEALACALSDVLPPDYERSDLCYRLAEASQEHDQIDRWIDAAGEAAVL